METYWSLYLLENSYNKKTYLGVSTDVVRRVRQHNNEISGGARYTKINKEEGLWFPKVIVTNLTKNQALSFERTIKNMRKRGKGKTPFEKRLYLIKNICKNYNIINFI
jgi:putative endonuclease